MSMSKTCAVIGAVAGGIVVLAACGASGANGPSGEGDGGVVAPDAAPAADASAPSPPDAAPDAASADADAGDPICSLTLVATGPDDLFEWGGSTPPSLTPYALPDGTYDATEALYYLVALGGGERQKVSLLKHGDVLLVATYNENPLDTEPAKLDTFRLVPGTDGAYDLLPRMRHEPLLRERDLRAPPERRRDGPCRLFPDRQRADGASARSQVERPD